MVFGILYEKGWSEVDKVASFVGDTDRIMHSKFTYNQYTFETPSEKVRRKIFKNQNETTNSPLLSHSLPIFLSH